MAQSEKFVSVAFEVVQDRPLKRRKASRKHRSWKWSENEDRSTQGQRGERRAVSALRLLGFKAVRELWNFV
jgi:hypothetical protein